MSPRGDLPLIKQMLIDRIEDLCRHLLPEGRREGRLWVSHNPVEGDQDKEPALKVALTGDIGAWKDWRSGEKGDVIRLVAYLTCGGDARNTVAALRWSRGFLGFGPGFTPEQRRQAEDKAEKARRAREKAAERKAKARRWALDKLWREAAPLGSGTAAEAHGLAYLSARMKGRHSLLDVPHLDRSSFRFHPDLEWWKGAEYRTRPDGTREKVRPGPSFPAIIAAQRSATGQLMGVHCTFLDPVKPAKAPVDAPKLMFGEHLGAPVRISHGPEGLPPEQAVEAHPTAINEGIEKAIPMAIELAECRCFSASSLAGYGAFPVDLPCISALYVAQDNDWTTPQAIAQFEAAIDALRKHGKPVLIFGAHEGKDFNDLF